MACAPEVLTEMNSHRSLVFWIALAAFLFARAAAAQTQVVDLSVNSPAGAVVRWAGPQANAAAGATLARGELSGDVNRRDMIIGAPSSGPSGQGQVFAIISGPKRTGVVSLSTANIIVTGEAAGDGFGTAIAAGALLRPFQSTLPPPRDLVVGAPSAAGGNGAVYVFAAPFSSKDVRSAAAAPFKVLGNSGERLGANVGTADLDGDGYRDLVMFASGSGRVYVIYGGPALSGVWNLAVHPADVTISGIVGAAAFAGGDLTNDGASEMAISSPNANSGAGAVYIVKGRPRAQFKAAMTFPADASAVFSGIDAGDHAGAAIAVADFDSDGVSDLIVTAPDAAGPGNSRPGGGEAYVIYGRGSFASASLASADLTIFGAASGNHFGSAVASGRFRGDQGGDLVFVAPGANAPAGELHVIYSRARSLLTSPIDLSSSGPDRILRGDVTTGPIRTVVGVEVMGGPDDIVAGVPTASVGTTAGAGLTYVAYSPKLAASSISFTVAQGATATATLNVNNLGTLNLGFVARSNSSWLKLSPTSGTTSADLPGQLSLTVTPGSLPVGTFHGGLAVLAHSPHLIYAVEVAVNLTVTPGTPTGPTITNPFGVPDPPDEGSPDGVATAVGNDVSVLPVRDVLVTFAHVTAAGRTTVTLINGTAVDGPGFHRGPWFYQVSTTASYTGPVTIGVAYDATLVTRWEGAVRLWNGSANVTSRVDPVRHLAFGTVKSIPATVQVVDDPRGVTFGSDNGFSYYGSGISGAAAKNLSIYPMRFSGRAATDFFMFNAADGRWKIAVNNGLGMYRFVDGQWSPGWRLWIVDLNGDGFDDIFLYNPNNGIWFRVLNDQHGGFGYEIGQWSGGWNVTPVDLNADGRTDLFLYNPASGAWVEVFNESSGTFRYVSGQWSPGWSIYPADLNGDGLSDLFLFNPATGVWVEVFNSAGGAFTYQVGQWSTGWSVYPISVTPDRATDLFLFNPSTGIWFIVENTGSGPFTYKNGQWSAGWTVTPVDMNGDGRTDLLLRNSTGVWVKVMTGLARDFSYEVGRWTPDWTATPGDVNGDGIVDFWLTDATGTRSFAALNIAAAAPSDPTSVSGAAAEPGGATVDANTGNLGSTWSAGWRIMPMRLHRAASAASDFFLYNDRSGQWAMAINDGTGLFAYTGGQWSAGWQTFPLDLNGDGYDDLFLYNPNSGMWVKALNDQHRGFTYVTGQWSAGWTVMPADLDGDLRPDLFLYNASTGVWVQVINEAAGTFRYTVGNWSAGWSVYPADLDGDGRSDLFLYNPATGMWMEALNSSTGAFTYASGQWPAGLSIYPVSMNGDARTDLFLHNPVTGGFTLALTTGTGTFTFKSGVWSTGWTITPVDLNGDRRTDLVLYNAMNGVLVEAFATSTADFTYEVGRLPAGITLSPADINGDGIVDVLLYNARTGAMSEVISR